MSRARNWTESERQTLRLLWNKAAISEIATALDRAESSIYSKARDMHLDSPKFRRGNTDIIPETLQLAENIFAFDQKSFDILIGVLLDKHPDPDNRHGTRHGSNSGPELQAQGRAQSL